MIDSLTPYMSITEVESVKDFGCSVVHNHNIIFWLCSTFLKYFKTNLYIEMAK